MSNTQQRQRWRRARLNAAVRLGLAVAAVSAGLVAAPAATHAAPVTPQTFSDFDGDGRTDLSIFRPSTHEWSIRQSSNGAATGRLWGDPGDWPVPADYDGDGRTDAAIWRPATGVWWIVDSSTGIGRSQQWGYPDDIPVPGDYDGDGRTDIAIWRPSTGVWWIISSSTGAGWSQQWGEGTDWPVPGDYDGDGRTDIAIWRARTHEWWIIDSSTWTVRGQLWGDPGDWPVPGDYDGDGRTDIAVWRASTGEWHIINSTTWTARSQSWGDPEDQPVPGDYDGDGRTDIAIWRPSTGMWWIINSRTVTVWSHKLGQREDLPVANTQQFVPKLAMQSLTPGAQGVVVDQGSMTGQVPIGQTLRVLVRGNPRVAVTTSKSTTSQLPPARRLGHRDSDLATGVAAARQAQTPHRELRGMLVHDRRQCDVAGRDGDGTIRGTFNYNPVAFDQPFTVPENVHYVDTVIDLQPGDGVEIDGSGIIHATGSILHGNNGPDGWPGRFGAGVPAPNAPVYSLVAQVGGTCRAGVLRRPALRGRQHRHGTAVPAHQRRDAGQWARSLHRSGPGLSLSQPVGGPRRTVGRPPRCRVETRITQRGEVARLRTRAGARAACGVWRGSERVWDRCCRCCDR